MDARISMVTLGVADLERSLRFYRDGLGWRLSGASGGDVAFFHTGGVILALYPRALLAADANLSDGGADSGFGGFTLAHNVASKARVDEVLGEAAAAGGTIIKPAGDVFWGGYTGYFADPDGHPWEVAWNPQFPLADDGTVTLPE